MRIEANYIPYAIAIGIGATLIMDLWNLFLKRAFSIPSLNYCLLGRWLRHMPGGTFRHASITAAPQKPFECTVGWIAHYTIGVVFALVLVVLTSGDWLARPTLLLALLYGIGTVVFPFFIMQPSFGLGIGRQRVQPPAQLVLRLHQPGLEGRDCLGALAVEPGAYLCLAPLEALHAEGFAAWSQWAKYAHNYLSFPFTLFHALTGLVAMLVIRVHDAS